MVRCVPGEMNCLRLQGPDLEHLIVIEKTLKHALNLIRRYVVPLAEQILNSSDTLADADGRLVALYLGQAALEIRTGGDMVGMCVGLQDQVYLIALFPD